MHWQSIGSLCETHAYARIHIDAHKRYSMTAFGYSFYYRALGPTPKKIYMQNIYEGL